MERESWGGEARMAEAPGGGEEPDGGFEGWKGVFLAWRAKGEGEGTRARVQGGACWRLGLPARTRGALEHPLRLSVLVSSRRPLWLLHLSPRSHHPE